MNEKKRIAFVKLYPEIPGEIFTIHTSLKEWIEKNNACANPSYITFQNETTKYNPLWSKYKFIYLDPKDYQGFLDKVKDINDRFDLIIFEGSQRMFDSGYDTSILRFINLLSVPIISIINNSYSNTTILKGKLMNTLVVKSRLVYTLSQSVYEKFCIEYAEMSNKIVQFYEWVEVESEYTQEEMKRIFGLNGKQIIISVGEMKPSTKFDELVKKMKPFLKKHEDYLMIIVGSTDRSEISHDYHTYLENVVMENGLKDKVWIIDQAIEERSLSNFLEMSDIFISPITDLNTEYDPYMNMALHHKNLILAAPYIYAKEVIGHQRGVIFSFEHNDFITETLESIVEDEDVVNSCVERGYNFSKKDKSSTIDGLNTLLTSKCIDIYSNRYVKQRSGRQFSEAFQEKRYMEV